MTKPSLLAAAALVLLPAAVLPDTAWAADGPGSAAHGSAASEPAPGPDAPALRAALAARPGEPVAGALGRVAEDGRTWRGSTGDLVTGRPVSPDAAFRIGSISKTFTAVVLLQLAAEHRIDLDGTVQHYLPGAIPDSFRPITIRQLLDHTSGLPTGTACDPSATPDQQIAGRFGYQSFDEIIQQTLRPTDCAWPGPVFAPGTAQQYNSFGYRVAGAVIEHVTGHSYRQEVTARILAPLGLRHTLVPSGDPELPPPHLPGYWTNGAGRPVDVSEAGGNPDSMVSTTGDLDRFLRALLGGELLPPAGMADLLALPRDPAGRLVPSVDPTACPFGPDKGLACYSEGLMRVPLRDGTVLWGKTGHDLGYASGMFATLDLRESAEYAVAETATEPGLAGPAERLGVTAFGPFAP
ncbi:serine hydrolase domain-containing protein [Kitasatospora sp. NPDC052896]|uniref:serine hydrolase domain-containing protein n=1 Tax=Kitasatospora sp. NPDC052896 TaxID=3364061 RepID=UPI0037CC6F25